MTLDLTLYAITDSRSMGNANLPKQVEQAILGGATIIQYREKFLAGDEKEKEAKEILEICRKHNIPFLINDDVELAMKIDADGVHLGQSDMNPLSARKLLGDNKIIGVTAKTVEQAKKAEVEGANYLGSGAVFKTSTKVDAISLDHDLLDCICESVSIPVVAIGGIDESNILKLKGRKIKGFAVVSAIFHKENVLDATLRMKELAGEALLR